MQLMRRLFAILLLCLPSMARAQCLPADVAVGGTVECAFNTTVNRVGTTLLGTPAVSAYKGSSTTPSTAGITLSVDFAARTGLNHITVTTASDGTFYSSGAAISLVLSAGTLDGVSLVGTAVGSFTVQGTTIAAVAGNIGGLGTQAKADVNAEADTALADAGVTTTVTGRVDAAISTRLASASYSAAPSASAVAAAVLDVATTDHDTAGTIGAAIGNAGAAGDPWATTLPGAYAAPQAGALFSHLDVDISSRAAAGGTISVTGPVASSGTITIFEGTDYLGPDVLRFNASAEDFSDVSSVKLVTTDAAGAAKVFTGAVVSATQLSVSITGATEPAATERWGTNGWVQIRVPYFYQIQVVRSTPTRNTIPFAGALIVRKRLAQS